MKKSTRKSTKKDMTLNAEIESLTEDLLAVKEQNAQLENLLQEKEKSEAALNDEIDSLVEDLLVLKEENAKMESFLQEKETLNKELQEVNQKLQETALTQTTQLEELQRLLQREQTEKEEKEATITALNNEINAIVDDLASIKESKCWIYTKPIRDLQKAIRGTND